MKKRISYVLIVAVFFCLAACNNSAPAPTQANDSASTLSAGLPDKKGFEDSIDGKKTTLFFLTNKNGMKAAITNYGGRIVGLLVPDKNGKLTDVVMGFSSVKAYQSPNDAFFGATIGRYGNRIAGGKFSLNGKQYDLFRNNGPNTLHGGKKGYQAVVWDASQTNDSTLVLSYLSKDLEEGFPGNLSITVTYSLTTDNGLSCEYMAKTDKETVVNLTNHSYFNLNGEGSGPITGHLLVINADHFTPVDSTLIPTGKIASVSGTAFDFTKPLAIGARINDSDMQLKNGKGYDHNFVLNNARQDGLIHAATVTGDRSGIVMDVFTQEPGLQFYSGNFMQGKNRFKAGAKDDFRTAFCLETQHFPDSPNQPGFPSTVLKPGVTYHTMSIYKFSVSR